MKTHAQRTRFRFFILLSDLYDTYAFKRVITVLTTTNTSFSYSANYREEKMKYIGTFML